MNNYEIMTIYKIDLGEAKAKELSAKVQEEISSTGGNVKEASFWGKRKFAYPIKHDTEGFYDVMSFDLDSSKVSELKSKLNLIEGLVRYLITAQD